MKLDLNPTIVFEREKKFLFLVVGVPSIIAGVIGVLAFGWHNFVLTLAIPMVPTIFLIGPYPIKIISFVSKKIHWINKLTFDGFTKSGKPKFVSLKDFELTISKTANYSRLRTWYYVCIIPFMLSISFSYWMGPDFMNFREPITSSGTILLTAFFFMPASMFIGISLANIDSSNLLIPTKRGERRLASRRIMAYLSMTFFITTFYKVFTEGRPEDADYYRALVIFTMFHSAAIFYITFLERQFVQNVRKYLIKQGVSMQD